MKTIENKRANILNTALGLVRNLGFESVSIATLAKEVGMSKSGLFAHFNSKEKMHIMILDHAAMTFSEEVFRSAIHHPRGLTRLKAIVENWLVWYQKDDGGTCPFVAASVEYDSKPGPVKDRIKMHTRQLIRGLEKAISLCIEEGHLQAHSSTEQMTYELYSLIIGHLIYNRTMEFNSSGELFQKALEGFFDFYKPEDNGEPCGTNIKKH